MKPTESLLKSKNIKIEGSKRFVNSEGLLYKEEFLTEKEDGKIVLIIRYIDIEGKITEQYPKLLTHTDANKWRASVTLNDEIYFLTKYCKKS
jgi:hypothetical protein